jgi:DnaK suppressor protein
VDEQRAQELLEQSRRETEQALARLEPTSPGELRDPADDRGDEAETLLERGTDEAIAESLRGRLEAIERAEQRLREGTYGRSVISGEPIPEGRLEAEPWAELTVDEAARA